MKKGPTELAIMLDKRWLIGRLEKDCAIGSSMALLDAIDIAIRKIGNAQRNAVEDADCFGIAPDCAQNFHTDSEMTSLNFSVESDSVVTFRKCKEATVDWNKEMAKILKYRGGRK